MEFPDSEKHCSERTCLTSDFLLMKCDACEKLFCSKHMSNADHLCPSLHKQDAKGPVVPLCTGPYLTTPGLRQTDHNYQQPQNIQENLATELSPNTVFMDNQVPVTYGKTDQGNTNDEALARVAVISIPELNQSENRNHQKQAKCATNGIYWCIAIWVITGLHFYFQRNRK